MTTKQIDRNTATYIGIDAHPTEHTALAMNRFEDEKGQMRFENTPKDIQKFLDWIPTVDPNPDTVVIGIEGGSGSRVRLITELINTYYHVYEVNGLFTKQRRTFGTRADKSDPKDAKLIAEVLTRKLDELPRITPNELTESMLCLKKAVWFYDDVAVLGARCKIQLHQLKREYMLSPFPEERQLLDFIIHEVEQALQVHKITKTEVTKRLKPLLLQQKEVISTMPGLGTVSAAQILAYSGGSERFETVNKFIRYAGIAPVEKSSGKNKTFQKKKVGNRRLNSIFYMAARSQILWNPEAKKYYEKKLREGKTKRQAKTFVMKRIATIVYGLMRLKQPYTTK